MRKQYFSLVELLMVIGIIALLMGILIPTVANIREKAKVTKALSEINAIKTAIKQYESTYGLLPIRYSGSTPQQEWSDTDANYNLLMEWLTQSECTGNASLDTTGNLRKIKLLDPRPKGGSWLDPWADKPGHATNGRYVIYVDHDYDGKVTIDGTDYNGSIFIYSCGSNLKDDKGLNRANGGGSGTDDVNSWDK